MTDRARGAPPPRCGHRPGKCSSRSVLADDGSHQREAVAPQVGAGDADDHVTGPDVGSVDAIRPARPRREPLRPDRPGRVASPRGARRSHRRAAARRRWRTRRHRGDNGAVPLWHRAAPPPCSRPARVGAPPRARSSTHMATRSCPTPSQRPVRRARSSLVPTPSVVSMSTGCRYPGGSSTPPANPPNRRPRHHPRWR